MRNFSVPILIIVASVGFSGCASQTGWTPTVDTYGDPNAGNLSRDMADCRYLAEQASGGTARESVTGGLIGGLVGAAGGAAIGAAVGSPGTGAAIGAAAGGLGGAAHQGYRSEQTYKGAYSNCMRNRGHNVVY
ncbi:MAG: hypothetical protein ACREWG_08450 [Gammaproteobacteria bacterium]